MGCSFVFGLVFVSTILLWFLTWGVVLGNGLTFLSPRFPKYKFSETKAQIISPHWPRCPHPVAFHTSCRNHLLPKCTVCKRLIFYWDQRLWQTKTCFFERIPPTYLPSKCCRVTSVEQLWWVCSSLSPHLIDCMHQVTSYICLDVENSDDPRVDFVTKAWAGGAL